MFWPGLFTFELSSLMALLHAPQARGTVWPDLLNDGPLIPSSGHVVIGSPDGALVLTSILGHVLGQAP